MEQLEAIQRKADMGREAMLLRAGFHVQAAKAQRIMYRAYAARAVAHTQALVLPMQYLQTLPMSPMLLQQMVSKHSQRQPLQKMTKQKIFPV